MNKKIEINNIEATEASTTNEDKKESKSAMIRRMHFEEGMSVNDIHKTTGILYQMVRNIVVKEKDARELSELRNQPK